MGGKIENVRLRLISDDSDEDRKNKKRNVRPRCCCLCPSISCCLKICCVIVVLSFLVFIAVRVVDILKVLKNKKDKRSNIVENVIPGSDLCKSVNADNMSLVALGYLKGIKGEKSTVEAKNQIYYITNRLFTDQEACAIEALLRLFQDKSVFIIEIGNFKNQNTTKTDYTKFLAKVLLVWQFGGTVLSPNFILLTRRVFDNNEGFCEVDRDLLFCPNQCSAYVYELVKSVLDTLRSDNKTCADWYEHIVDKSVVDYCGDPSARLVGCVGINRIKPYSICHIPKKDCDFLRVEEWKEKDIHWKTVVQKFCPKIISKFKPVVGQQSEDSVKTTNIK